jgi:hypothetical protein
LKHRGVVKGCHGFSIAVPGSAGQSLVSVVCMTMRDCDGVNFPIDIVVVSIMLWFIDDKIDPAVTLTLLKFRASALRF